MIFYFLKNGMKNIIGHKLMALASVCIMAASLMLLGLFVAAGLNVNSLMSKIGDSYEINVYLKSDAAGRAISDIEGEISDISGVANVKFYSREDRLKKVTEEVYGDEGYAFSSDNNPLRDSYVVTVSDLSQSDRITAVIQDIDGIEEVIRNQDIIGGIDTITKSVKNIGLWIMIIFLLLSVFIISNTIKLGVASQGAEIGIMKIVGATNGFIRGPFVVQGLLLGVFGAVPASLILILGYGAVVNKISDVVSPDILTLVAVPEVAGLVVPLFFGLSILVGVVGSYVAAGKYFK